MQYIKAKYPHQSRSYTFKTEDDVKPGDTVVNAKGVKLEVVDGPVDMAWLEAYGTANIVIVKKYEEPAGSGERKEKKND